MNRLISTALTIALFSLNHAKAQTEKRKADIPGAFLLEFGFNRPRSTPENFDIGFFGSRTLNVYYQHDFKLTMGRKLNLVPGIGFGFERYLFRNNYTLSFESSKLVMDKTKFDISKSQLITNYLDVPFEIKYVNNPDDPARSFKMSGGFRFGYLISGLTKVKYEDESLGKIKDKSKADWNLNKIRYGPYGKVGFGNFSLFGYYNLAPLFKEGQGPDESSVNNITFGISLSGF